MYNTRYLGLNWHATKAKCIFYSDIQTNTYLQNQIVIFSSKTFLQTVWLPAGKSIVFFFLLKKKEIRHHLP